MSSDFKLLLSFLTALTVSVGSMAAADSAVVRSQVLALERGWNAVYLEVDPLDPEPASVFAGTPVDVAASFYARAGSAQYITDPDADIYRRAGWGVWYAPGRPDSFLSTLHAVSGQRAYLLHATEDHLWQVSGYVVRLEVRWQPDAFNLTGFSVAETGAPTFAQFFAGSKAHDPNRIYRLENNSWRRVSDPTAERMRSGEAFWVYCGGGSSYQGPLRVELAVQQGVVLGRAPVNVVLRNDTPHPLTPTIEHVAAQGEPVPMSLVMQGVRSGEGLIHEISAPFPVGPWVQELPVLEAGEGIRIPIEGRREAIRYARQASLLRISTDLGTEEWIPVISVRQDLEEQ